MDSLLFSCSHLDDKNPFLFLSIEREHSILAQRNVALLDADAPPWIDPDDTETKSYSSCASCKDASLFSLLYKAAMILKLDECSLPST